jgi:hypothetical protein
LDDGVLAGRLPVPLSALRLLTVSYWDFADNVQTGELVVNRSTAAQLAKVSRQLYRLRLPDPSHALRWRPRPEASSPA